MIINKGIIVTHKRGGKVIKMQTMQQDFGCARIMNDAVSEEVSTVPVPKSISVKPTVKAEVSSVAPAKQAEPQPAVQSATHKSGSLSNRRQSFTYGGQTIPIH